MPSSLHREADLSLRAVYERAKSIGLLGPGPVEAHIAHAQFFAEAIEGLKVATQYPPARAIDLGSGGGVPGLVLAYLWPECEILLLDAAERRTEFLQSAVDELGLNGRVSVLRGRAEELGRDPELRESQDVVAARSFAQPAVVAECASPFLTPGGVLLVSEPPDASHRWPAEPMVELALERVNGSGPIAILRKTGVLNERFPRRVGIPEKRPLF